MAYFPPLFFPSLYYTIFSLALPLTLILNPLLPQITLNDCKVFTNIQGLIQKEKVDIDGEKGVQISIVPKKIVTQG